MDNTTSIRMATVRRSNQSLLFINSSDSGNDRYTTQIIYACLKVVIYLLMKRLPKAERALKIIEWESGSHSPISSGFPDNRHETVQNSSAHIPAGFVRTTVNLWDIFRDQDGIKSVDHLYRG
jgi:hypothetical protein